MSSDAPPQHSSRIARMSDMLNHPAESHGMPLLPFRGFAAECLSNFDNDMLTGVHDWMYDLYLTILLGAIPEPSHQ